MNEAKETTKLMAHVASNMVDSSLFSNIRTKNDTTSLSYANIFSTLNYVNSSEVIQNIYTLYYILLLNSSKCLIIQLHLILF